MSIRPSPIAGTWYPSDASALARSVDEYLSRAPVTRPVGRIWGVVAPHAGHRYSGAVAAYAFNCLRGLDPELVAVISPMHHAYRSPLLTTAHDAYRTPLGEIPVDRAALAAVERSLFDQVGLRLSPVRNDPEHSLEIELPFLQRVLAKFALLPVMVLDQTPLVAEALGRALAEVLRPRRAVLVASSDLSHFYPRDVADALDAEMLGRIESFDPTGVMQAEEEGRGFACGHAAIAAVLWAARGLGADRVKILRHATSGDVTGDYDSVVGYGAAVIWQSDEPDRAAAG